MGFLKIEKLQNKQKKKVIFCLLFIFFMLLLFLITFLEFDGIRDFKFIKDRNEKQYLEQLEEAKNLFIKGKFLDSRYFFVRLGLNSEIRNTFEEIDKEIIAYEKKGILDNNVYEDEKIKERIEYLKHLFEYIIFENASYNMCGFVKDQCYLNFLEKKYAKKIASNPSIYKYFYKLTNVRVFLNFNIKAKMYDSADTMSKYKMGYKNLESAILFKLCGNYKDSEKRCSELIEKAIFERIHEFETRFSVYPLDVSLFYYYQSLGGDMDKLNTRLNDVIRKFYDEAVRESNSSLFKISELDLSELKLNKEQSKAKLDSIQSKLEWSNLFLNALCIFQDNLRDYNNFKIINLKIDFDYIKDSKSWYNKNKEASQELTKYKALIESQDKKD